MSFNPSVISIVGDARQLISIDSYECEDEDEQVLAQVLPIEYLNALTPSGLPPHLLNVKLNAVCMLLRNIDMRRKFCNGSHVRIVHIGERVLHIRSICDDPQDLLLSRMPLTSKQIRGMQFALRRLQFPLRLAYAVTINKVTSSCTLNRVT